MSRKLALASIVIAIFSAIPAQAGRIEPRPISCWLFQGERIELKNTCIYESTSWLGGGGSKLRWEDGVVTQIQWGLVGRGERVCRENEQQIDGVCGKIYYRRLGELSRILNSKYSAYNNRIFCVQLKQKSICWKF
jgi:hypothetical protein